MRFQYQFFAGPSLNSATLNVPRAATMTKVLAATASIRRGAVPLSQVQCVMKIVDGAGNLVLQFVLDANAAGAAGSVQNFMFAYGIPSSSFLALATVGAEENWYFPIPSELWIPPQAQLSFTLGLGLVADDIFTGVNLTTLTP